MRPGQVAFGFVLLMTTATAQQYVISTIAGGPPRPVASSATETAIGFTLGVATDARSNVYFTSADLNSLFKLDPAGVATRVAGNTIAG